MHFSSDSDVDSPFQQNQQNSGTTREKTKQKKIKKDFKKESYQQPITSLGTRVSNILEFIKHEGQKYFSKDILQLENQLNSSIKASVHIKNILSLEQNVYQIQNYQESLETALQYSRFMSDLQKLKHLKIGMRLKQSKLTVNCFFAKKIIQKKKAMRILTKTQTFLWSQRKNVLKQVQFFFKRISNKKEVTEIPFLQKEILTLCKLNGAQQNQIIDKISQKSQLHDQLFNIHQEDSDITSKQIKNQYVGCLIRKNLEKGFDQTPVDFLNYFKVIQNTEKNVFDDVPLKKIKNVGQLKDYLRSRKPKQGKSIISLRTCCAGCFSNYYQLSNPIETCTNCGMRMHKFCQKIKGKCQRCKYIRRIPEEKSYLKICKICQGNNEKGLLIQRIGHDINEQYAHTFCLLVHNLWTIYDGQLQGVIQSNYQKQGKCKICDKTSSQLLECLDCEGRVHGMCAFFAGYSLQTSLNNTVQVRCSRSQLEQERLSLERRYKLNYQNFLYKSGSQLFKLIEGV